MVAVHPTKGASARSHAASSVHVTAVHPAVPKIVGEGTLVLATTPWCSVSIDKIDRGTTPLTVKLAAGSHALVLTNTEFKVHRSLSVVIQPNEMLRKRLDFDQ